jgi:hypothetical protein
MSALSDHLPLGYQPITSKILKVYRLLERLLIAHCGRSSLYVFEHVNGTASERLLNGPLTLR